MVEQARAMDERTSERPNLKDGDGLRLPSAIHTGRSWNPVSPATKISGGAGTAKNRNG
jgi:hypothetical protein